MYQTSLKRNEHLEGTIPDIRNIFIGFGKYLAERKIIGQGSIEDYENYLNKMDKQKEQQRQDEHLELICWILEQTDWENYIMIIKGEEYDRFYYSDDDDEMNMIIADCNEFYNKFKEFTGVNLLNVDCFVKMTYIDNNKNDIEVVININGNNERFIICI